MRSWLVFLVLGVTFLVPLGAETLWVSAFDGYLPSRPTELRVGDVLSVRIDAVTAVAFQATENQDHSITIELTGGAADALFSFLPTGVSGNSRSSQGAQETTVQATMAALVVAVSAQGTGVIQGSRTISVDGRAQSLSISGTVDPAMVKDRQVAFSSLADATLTVRTSLGQADVLAAADFLAATAGAASAGAPTVGLPAPEVPLSVPEAGAPTSAAPGGGAVSSLVLSPAAQQELLLQYLNTLLGPLFP